MSKITLTIYRIYTSVLLFALVSLIVFDDTQGLRSLSKTVISNMGQYLLAELKLDGLLPSKDTPVGGFRRLLMPVEGEIAATYGEPLLTSGKANPVVNGTMLKCRPGAKVFAGEDGVVYAVRYSKKVGWYVDIDHGNGIFSRYANLSNISVKQSEKVTRGEIIANVSKAYNGKFFLQLFIEGKAVNPVTASQNRKGI